MILLKGSVPTGNFAEPRLTSVAFGLFPQENLKNDEVVESDVSKTAKRGVPGSPDTFQLDRIPLKPFFLFVDPLDQRTRVMSCTQFVSQVLPSSGESACSQWPNVGVMLDQMKRARTRFPLTVSSP